MTHQLRAPCIHCTGNDGRIVNKNGQDCVYCCGCNRFQYNAPKTETGRATRTVSTVHANIKPNQRSRILVRANRRCELCGKPIEECATGLHVGHMISVDAGLRDGLAEAELNDDENLVAMCDECNLGLKAEPMPLRFCLSVVMARTKFLAKLAERAA